MRRYFVLIVYVIFVGLLTLSGWFDKPVFGISKTYYAIVASVIYFIYILIVYIKNYNFFSYNDQGVKLVFKFISLRPFDNKRKSIEILKRNFRGYKIQKTIFNIKVDLILSVETKNGVANYPPISITALTSKYKNILKNSLRQIVS